MDTKNPTNSKTFCYLPFGSIHVTPKGELHPCCMSAPFEDGIVWDDFDSIDDLYNSEPYRRIRKQMVSNKEPKECKVCFELGSDFRENNNKMYNEFAKAKDLVNDDFTINKLTYVDLRLSNMCNFMCRMCSHELSSSWYDYWEYISGQSNYKHNNPKFLVASKTGVGKLSETNIDTIRKIYLAGGEPFITPQTFELLDRFNDEQASKVEVLINTNLSTLSYKGRDILKELSRFKYITIACSIDGVNEVGEYQRPGFKTSRFERNFKTLLDAAESNNKFFVEIDCTVSTMNVFHLPDFLSYLNSNSPNFSINNFRLHSVYYPFYFSCFSFSDEILDEVSDMLFNLKVTYKQHGSFVESVRLLSNSIFVNRKADYLEHNRSQLHVSLPKVLKTFDDLHNTDYKKVCPWLDDIMYGGKTLL